MISEETKELFSLEYLAVLQGSRTFVADLCRLGSCKWAAIAAPPSD